MRLEPATRAGSRWIKTRGGSALRLEVVFRHVLNDLSTEGLRLHIGGAVVEARPDARLDDLLERLREPFEVPRLTSEAAARHIEPDLVGAEEHLQHAQLRTVETKVPGRVLGIRRGDERRPRRISHGRGIAVPVRLVDR